MDSMPDHRITLLLHRASDGDRGALNRLIPLVYDELCRIASRYLRHERPGHTLDTSALVHEAYLRLIDQQQVAWQNRAHFFALSANAMRRILIDHARRHRAIKRGAGQRVLTLTRFSNVLAVDSAADLLELDAALHRLEALDPRKSRVVEYQFFGGLTVDETAEVMGISPAMVRRDRRFARAWLYRQLMDSLEK